MPGDDRCFRLFSPLCDRFWEPLSRLSHVEARVATTRGKKLEKGWKQGKAVLTLQCQKEQTRLLDDMR